jgi:hypothetical protein
MAFVHGKNTKVLVGEYDLTGFFDSASAAFTREMAATTVFGLDDHTYLPGIGSGSVTLGGLWDNTAVSGSDVLLDAALDGSQQVVSVSPQGISAVGQRGVLLNARQGAYNWNASISDVVRLDSDRTADGGIRGGVVLHQLTAETSTGNFASVDNGASSAFGAVGHLHVTAFSGTSATIKITDSTDNAVFSDLITFTAVTAAGAERSTVAGTVNQYARVELSGIFTSVTFAVLFARNLQ